MFYPVRVLGPKEQLIRTIGTARLSKRHWDMFREEEGGRFLANGDQKKSLQVKKHLDMEFSNFGFTPLFQ